MKQRMTWMAVALVGALAMLQVAYAQSSAQAKAEVALRAAMETETVKGDLKGAIERYKKLAQGSNRAIAAQALLHMGDCYEKLGSNEADKQYALVISKFADQKDAVAQARAHLGGAAAKTNGMVNRPVWESDQAGSAGAVSPDGRYISFTERNDGRRNLALHDLTTGMDRRLTDAASDESPDESAFSPDGKQIARASGIPPKPPKFACSVCRGLLRRYPESSRSLIGCTIGSPGHPTAKNALAAYVYKRGVKGSPGDSCWYRSWTGLRESCRPMETTIYSSHQTASTWLIAARRAAPNPAMYSFCRPMGALKSVP